MRLFAGIAIASPAQEALGRLVGGVRGARWVAAHNLHLTLHFAGDMAPPDADDLDAALATVTAPPFPLALAGVGVFESRGRANAVWAGLADDGGVRHLKRRLDGALVQAGFEPERRKFKPHVTLARMKNVPVGELAPWLETHAGFAAEPFEVTAFHLYRSHLGHAGAEYEILVDYPLAAA